MKARHPVNDNVADRARLVWERRAGSPLSDEEVRQQSANLAGFFSILAEWDRAANDNPAHLPAADVPESRKP